MTELPPSWAALGEYKQWTLWHIVMRASGKEDKEPISPQGYAHDPHRPENMLWYRDCAALAAQLTATGHPCWPGFVLTMLDPFFFVDVDKALNPDGTWSQVALDVFRAFPGAAYETSWSRRGFHLVGSTSEFVLHSNKRDDLGIELYIARRFIANTFWQPSGDARTDLTHYYKKGALWFPPGASAEVDLAEFSKPDPDYGGPADDAELIALLLQQQPKPGKATTRQLWEADPALGEFWPDPQQGRAFDANSADLALCSALAFWTGRDAPRMDRLFRQSGLMRAKWAERPYIVARTISRAIAGCSAVYQGRSKPAVIDLQSPLAPALTTGYQFLAPDQQLNYFAGCWYVEDRHQVWTPRGRFLSPPVFNSVYGGYVFAMDTDNSDTTKKAFEAFVESRAIRRPIVDTTTFRPTDPPGQVYDEGGLRLLNVYVPANVPSAPGDVSPFLDLVARQYPVLEDQQILLTYMARCVQKLGVKFQWAVLVQGIEGNGKTFLSRVLTAAIGEKYTTVPKASDVGNKFNAAFQFKLLAIIEELKQQHNAEIIEALKILITNERIEYQPKGRDQYTGDNTANLFLTSNFQDGARKHRGDRRICPLFSDQQTVGDLERCGLTSDYFLKLWDWFRDGGSLYTTHFLQTYEGIAKYDPAAGCTRAPASSSTERAIEVSRNAAEELIAEAIGEERLGFRGGWVSSVAVSALFRHVRGDARARHAALDALGYVPHPKLLNGRSRVAIMVDGGAKSRLYVKPGSIQATSLTPEQIAPAYEAAQARDPVAGPDARKGVA